MADCQNKIDDFHAVFDIFGESPEATANETIRAIRDAASIRFPDGFGGNGTMRTIRNRWLKQYVDCLIKGLNGEC